MILGWTAGTQSLNGLVWGAGVVVTPVVVEAPLSVWQLLFPRTPRYPRTIPDDVVGEVRVTTPGLWAWAVGDVAPRLEVVGFSAPALVGLRVALSGQISQVIAPVSLALRGARPSADLAASVGGVGLARLRESAARAAGVTRVALSGGATLRMDALARSVGEADLSRWLRALEAEEDFVLLLETLDDD